jgi:hypothetical protein
MSKNISDQIVEMLVEVGVKRVYAVIGDSRNLVNDSIRRRWQTPMDTCKARGSWGLCHFHGSGVKWYWSIHPVNNSLDSSINFYLKTLNLT